MNPPVSLRALYPGLFMHFIIFLFLQVLLPQCTIGKFKRLFVTQLVEALLTPMILISTPCLIICGASNTLSITGPVAVVNCRLKKKFFATA